MAAIHIVSTRQKVWFYALPALLGLALRLWLAANFLVVSDDSLIYADIAKNWIHHGMLGVTDTGVPVPELIRLPGYPGFLALIFAVFGDNAFRAVQGAQILIDLATCGAAAMLAGELVSARIRPRVRAIAFAIACLCPFTASYAALPLTETLAIACTAWALLFAVRTLRTHQRRDAVACGLLAGYGMLLRPDNGIVLGVVCIALLLVGARQRQMHTFRAAFLIGVIAVLPLIPWTIRNWKVFHIFQPLAPRYANQPGEFVPHGFNRWTKTWMADYVSVEEIYWRVDDPKDSPEVELLPDRAFDNAEERTQTAAVFAELSDAGGIDATIDAKFAALARQRIMRRPFRYYVVLPAKRVADMWLRPRTEMFPLERRWWEWEEPNESWISVGLAALNLLLVAAGIAGAWRCRRSPTALMLISFVIIRSVFLGSVETPEPRYTLQMYPLVLAFGGVALAAIGAGRTSETASGNVRTGN
jgi:4-amino-4-deoxy-L-arabinose transferase-like glycosyltransferase